MGLFACPVLETLAACAKRDDPVGPHLDTVIQRLERLIVECVLPGLGLRRPDERFVGVGEAFATEIGHRVRLAPDDVIQDPEALILKLRPHAEDIVVGADHPECAVGLQEAPGGREPFAGELVVGLEAGELVPGIVHGIDLGIVRAMQIAA